MKRIIFSVVSLLIFSAAARAQSETLDIATFTPPAGWSKQSKEGVVIYVNTSQNSYCVLSLYRSRASAGNVEADFKTDWRYLVVKSFKVTNPPANEAALDDDGWKVLSGTATFKDESGGTSAVLLTTISGFGRAMSVVVVLNDQQYMPTIEKFLNSIKLTKPAINESESSRPAHAPPANGGGSSGITNSTTNFNDGWTATIHDEYVLVSKGNARVYLFYGIELTGEVPRNNLISEYFWKTVVAPRYNIQSAVNLTPTVPDGTGESLYYIEGNGSDNKTGKSCFVGMRVLSGHVVRVIVGTAPDKQSYYAQFPNPDALHNMINANRFAVSKTDMIGFWKDGFYGDITYYNTNTGANAGTVAASGANEFTFQADGAYQHRSVGANASRGYSYDQKIEGKFSVSNWDVMTTNSKGGKTVYEAYFEAVKGGRILHLTDKQFTSHKFHLGKAR